MWGLTSTAAMFWYALFTILALSNPPVKAGLPLEQFFLYGENILDSYVPLGDDNFIQVPLRYGFRFFNTVYSSLFLNVNVAITFGQGVSNYTPTCGSLTTPMIAPFWADVDIRYGGNVTYRESTGEWDLVPATKVVTDAFPEYQGLNLGWAFIATWVNVPFYGENDLCNLTMNNSITNTFQVMLTSDGSNSFVTFNYNATTWTTGVASGGNCNGLGGIPAKAGFDVGDNATFHQSTGSCTAGILSIGAGSNTNVPGRYVYRVDSGYNPTDCTSFTNYYNELRITSSFVPINGHVPITIQGPCLDGATDLACSFWHALTRSWIRVPAVQVGTSNSALCIAPYLDTYAQLRVGFSLTRNLSTDQFFGSIYTVEPTPGVFPVMLGTSGNATVYFAFDSTVFGDSSVKLDLVLVENTGGMWVERSIAVSGIANSGSSYNIVQLGTPNITSAYVAED